MTKPLVFLSHINEEAELAGLFKAEIEQVFLGLLEVFVSSEEASISVGSKWLDRITEGLQSAQAIMILCSPASIGRPWINFEAGAGWARDVTVAPLCHSGLRPVQLPLPLNLLQAIEAHDEAQLINLFKMLAGKLNSATPSVDAKQFTSKVLDFENRYSVEVKAVPPLQAVQSLWPELVDAIKRSGALPINVAGAPDWKVNALRPQLERLKQDKLLDYNFSATGMSLGAGSSGITGSLVLAPTNPLVEIAKRRF